jgi:hypothetical protein
LESDEPCLYHDVLFHGTVMPKIMCDWESGFSLPGMLLIFLYYFCFNYKSIMHLYLCITLKSVKSVKLNILPSIYLKLHKSIHRFCDFWLSLNITHHYIFVSGFSLDKYLADNGYNDTDNLPGHLIDNLFDQLGISYYMNDIPCHLDDTLYFPEKDGWKNG